MKNKLNPNHIAGIYNYCDRWCERCSFTSRCAVYENTGELAPDENDLNNKIFWDGLSKNFAGTIAIMHEAAKEQGITINPVSDEEWEKYKVQKKADRDKASEHPLIKYSKAYMLQAKALLDKKGLLKQKGEEIIQQAELGIKTVAAAKAEVGELGNCLEIVQWYLFQIQVKFMRAIPMMPGEEADEAFASDSNGSAKVALIAVDRCIMAWQKIMQFLPDYEDDILQLLALLQRIQMLGEKAFPNARNFIRLGLDDE
jgi:hypothetical protein